MVTRVQDEYYTIYIQSVVTIGEKNKKRRFLIIIHRIHFFAGRAISLAVKSVVLSSASVFQNFRSRALFINSVTAGSTLLRQSSVGSRAV